MGPVESRELTGPGTAPTVRWPSSSAQSAVIRVPDLSVASTTIVTSLSAAMIRLRAGKLQRAGRSPGRASLTTAPPLARMRR